MSEPLTNEWQGDDDHGTRSDPDTQSSKIEDTPSRQLTSL